MRHFTRTSLDRARTPMPGQTTTCSCGATNWFGGPGLALSRGAARRGFPGTGHDRAGEEEAMDSFTSSGRPVRFPLALLAVLFALALPASRPAQAAPSGDCVTVRVDTPFRLPDGLVYPAGALT